MFRKLYFFLRGKFKVWHCKHYHTRFHSNSFLTTRDGSIKQCHLCGQWLKGDKFA